MAAGAEDATGAALTVGYESVTQFNREYKRLFGEPPRRDVNRWKAKSLIRSERHKEGIQYEQMQN
jgi:AraC-like DNA-binding protein